MNTGLCLMFLMYKILLQQGKNFVCFINQNTIVSKKF